MGFLPQDKAPNAHETQLCNELWGLVKGEEYGGVTFDTLRVAMLNMIGLKVKDRQIPVPSTPAPSDSASQKAAKREESLKVEVEENKPVNDGVSVKAADESAIDALDISRS